MQNSVCSLHPADILQNVATVKWRKCRRDKLLNKDVIFVLFACKKYYCSFITLQLNHWWQMDYFDNVFHTFLSLDSVIYSAVNGTVTSLLVFLQNILNCVPKTDKSFYGFGTTWGLVINDKLLILCGVNLLIVWMATWKIRYICKSWFYTFQSRLYMSKIGCTRNATGNQAAVSNPELPLQTQSSYPRTVWLCPVSAQ